MSHQYLGIQGVHHCYASGCHFDPETIVFLFEFNVKKTKQKTVELTLFLVKSDSLVVYSVLDIY